MRRFEELLQELLQKVVEMGTVVEGMIDLAVRTVVERNEGACSENLGDGARGQHDAGGDRRAGRVTHGDAAAGRQRRPLFIHGVANRGRVGAGSRIWRLTFRKMHIMCSRGRRVHPLVDLPIMAEVVQKMVRDTVNAMVKKDINLANVVLEEEDKVDAFRDQIFRTLLTYMMSDPRTIGRSLSLILISRNLERIGDHSTNIAEEVIYWVQGRDVRHKNFANSSSGRRNGSMDESRKAQDAEI